MVSIERSRKKVQLWKRAIVHFSLCFVMGFFTGFAPTGKNSFFSSYNTPSDKPHHLPPQPHQITNRSLQATSPVSASHVPEPEHTGFAKQSAYPGGLVIVVTPTSTKGRFQGVLLRRLANTMRLVAQPLLWVVVEGTMESGEVSEILRKTGIMYRHLVFKENFTDPEAELNHQRNVALKHIEHHRLSGIVHFAELSNVYDLDFFNQLREIEVFGTWPVAFLSANRRRVIIEGPVCDSSQVIGWHLRKMNQTESDPEQKPLIHISSFAFNSSILWDPERWGRPTSVQASQNSLNFVKQVVFDDDDTKLKGIPPEECSKIMLWRFHLPLGQPASQATSKDTRR